MNTENTTFRIRLTGLALLSIAWVLAPVTISFAAETGSQINIASNGQVIVRDAIVSKVDGNVILAQAAWGAASISWSVITTGATRISPSDGASLAQVIRPGDRISFSGSLDFSSGRPTVRASVVKNSDLVKRSAIIVGVAEAVDRAASTVSVKTESGNIAVYATAGTIVTFEGNGSSIRDIEIGDTVRAEGTLHTENSTLMASRIVYTHQEEAVDQVVGEEAASSGIVSAIVGWFMDTRGAFSLR